MAPLGNPARAAASGFPGETRGPGPGWDLTSGSLPPGPLTPRPVVASTLSSSPRREGIFPSLASKSRRAQDCQDEALRPPAHLAPGSQSFTASSAFGPWHVICPKALSHPPPRSGILMFRDPTQISLSGKPFPTFLLA